MDLEPTEEQLELQALVARLLSNKYNFTARKAILESPRGWSREIWSTFAETGLLGLPFGERYGGTNASFAGIALVMREFGRALVLEPYISTVLLGGGLVADAGSENQKTRILPGVITGETLLAFAGYEPARRYDLGRALTLALETGDGLSITGEKTAVWGASDAHYFIVTAANKDGVGLFLVGADAPGVRVHSRLQVDGVRSGSVAFTGAPAERLGTGDAGAIIRRVIDRANAAIMAEAVGAMEASLSMTVTYLKAREQFGSPIGANQALQHRAADAHALLEGAASMALYAQRAVEADVEPPVREEFALVRHRDIMAAKLYICRASREIAHEAVQLHGGIGMTMEYPIGHYLKRLTVISRTFDDADTVVRELSALGGLIAPYAADLVGAPA